MPEKNMGMADVVGAPPPPPAPPTWPDDKFATQLPRWSKAITEGLKTADEIVTLASSKGALTPEQEAAIRKVKKADTGEIVMTFAQVADKLNKADTTDKLAVAGSLIDMVQDDGQRKELSDLYDARADEIGN